MSHVTYEWVVSRVIAHEWVKGPSCKPLTLKAAYLVHESCHIWMSRVSCDCTWTSERSLLQTAYIESRIPCEWVMSHMNMLYCTWLHTNERKLPVEKQIPPSEWVLSPTHCNTLQHKHIPPSEWVLSPIHEACRVWMSHFTYEWVTSYMNETCHIWMRHITYECTWMSGSYLCKTTIHFLKESYYSWMSHVKCEWVTLQMRNVQAHHCNTLQPTAIHRNTLQHTATQRKMNRRHTRKEATRHNSTNKVCRAVCWVRIPYGQGCSASLPADWLQHAATRYNTLQRAATRCNTLQHIPLVRRGTSNALQHIATPHCVLPSKKNTDTVKPKIQSTIGDKEAKRHTTCAKSRVLPVGALCGSYLASLPSALSCLFCESSCFWGALLWISV